MHIGGEGTIIALGADRLVQKCIDRKGVGLAGLVGHLRHGLIDIDHGAVQGCKAHRHPGAGEEAWTIIGPSRRPVVIIGIEADTMCERNLCLRDIVAPHDTVCPVSRRGRNAGEGRGEGVELVAVERLQRGRCPVVASSCDM
jgi:hypothetical protein